MAVLPASANAEAEATAPVQAAQAEAAHATLTAANAQDRELDALLASCTDGGGAGLGNMALNRPEDAAALTAAAGGTGKASEEWLDDMLG